MRAHATCADLVAAFAEAVAAHSVDAAGRGLEAISDDPVCGGRSTSFGASSWIFSSHMLARLPLRQPIAPRTFNPAETWNDLAQQLKPL